MTENMCSHLGVQICCRNPQNTFTKKSQLKIINFQIEKHGYLTFSWSDKALQGTVVNQTCHRKTELKYITACKHSV